MSVDHVSKRCVVTERDGSTHNGTITTYIPLSPNYHDEEASAVYRVQLDRDKARHICYPVDMVRVIDA